MVTNKYHLQIISALKSINSHPDHEGFGLKYVGTNKPSYHLDTAAQKQVISDFLKENKLTPQEYFDLVTSLYTQGRTYDEIIIAGRLVGLSKFRQEIDPQLLDIWLSHVHGWAECDTLCQMAFTATDFLNRWPEWEKLLLNFRDDENVHKRRASLVLLTKPVGQSPDPRFSQLAFANVEAFKMEKDILITKAVSWILRSLIRNHSDEVAEYLDSKEPTLPRIAVREVRSKLLTGKKYVNAKKEKSRRL